jgi:hypothetical protein
VITRDFLRLFEADFWPVPNAEETKSLARKLGFCWMPGCASIAKWQRVRALVMAARTDAVSPARTVHWPGAREPSLSESFQLFSPSSNATSSRAAAAHTGYWMHPSPTLLAKRVCGSRSTPATSLLLSS